MVTGFYFSQNQKIEFYISAADTECYRPSRIDAFVFVIARKIGANWVHPGKFTHKIMTTLESSIDKKIKGVKKYLKLQSVIIF